jgi:hypothetical protein
VVELVVELVDMAALVLVAMLAQAAAEQVEIQALMQLLEVQILAEAEAERVLQLMLEQVDQGL